MAQPFQIPRNVELSCLEYLKTNVSLTWSGVTFLKTFAQVYAKNINLPVITVRLSDTNTVYREIGNTIMEDRYLLIVDIFCQNDPQRLDLGYTVKNLLRQGWIHYDWSRSSGDTTGIINGIPDGRDTVTQFVTDARVDFGDTVDTKDRYRQTISVRVRTSPQIPTY